MSRALRKRQQAHSRRSHQPEYQTLEPRQLLATSFTFAGGVLAIQVDEGVSTIETRDISGQSDAIFINNELAVDSDANAILASDVTDLSISGRPNTAPTLVLDGDFRSGDLNNLQISQLADVEFQGDFVIAEDFTLSSTIAAQPLVQQAGSIAVTGDTQINYNNLVGLIRHQNQFLGTFNATSSGLLVYNDFGIELGQIRSTGALIIDADGSVTQKPQTRVEVASVTNIDAIDKVILTNPGNEIRELHLKCDGADIVSETTVELGKIDVDGNLVIKADGNVQTRYNHQYDLNNSFGDSQFAGPDLTPLEGGTFANGQFQFGENEGLRLTTVLTSSDYYLEFEATLDSVDGFRKLVDFREGLSNAGLYVHNGRLTFRAVGNRIGTAVMSNGEAYTIGLQRRDGTVRVYLDGQLQFEFEDTGEGAVASVFNVDLFVDDTASFGQEGSSGSVNYVRITDQTSFVEGNLTIEATNDALLLGGGHDISGTVSIKGRHAFFNHDNKLNFRNVDLEGSGVFSASSIFDVGTARISVKGQAKFAAHSFINLGDKETDVFHTGLIQLNVVNGNALVSEDSSLRFTDPSSARTLIISAAGAITDSSTSEFVALTRAKFTAPSMLVGDTQNDGFDVRAIQLDIAGNAIINEDFATLFTSSSSVGGNLTINAASNILDTGSASLVVGGHAHFQALGVQLGDRAQDNLRLGSLSFDAERTVSLNEDDAMLLGRITTGASANLRSTSQIANLDNTKFSLTGMATLIAPTIDLGNENGDIFRTSRIRFESTGATAFRGEGDVIFSQGTDVGSLNLVTTGAIKDVSNAIISVDGHARLSGASITIGDSAGDFFRSGSLAFQSIATTSITSNADIELSGNSSARRLYLESIGDITDQATAETIIEQSAEFVGIDLIIGELANDCFDIINGPNGLTANGSGTVNIQLGC